ncbi:MAG: hypothetical protein UIM26_01875 [Longicatena sp.]|nr:hypothetical protein [Longicatena sp.]
MKLYAPYLLVVIVGIFFIIKAIMKASVALGVVGGCIIGLGAMHMTLIKIASRKK